MEEPLHVCAGEEGAVVELGVRGGIEGCVEDRAEEDLQEEVGSASLFAEVGAGGGDVAARTVADDGEA